MTLRDKFNEKIPRGFAKDCEKIADDYAIEILERYHNSLFIIPLKEGEAKEILQIFKKEHGL